MPNRIGLFGGTFDPPHLGHLILASEAQTQLELDRLLWILTPEPPHKQEQFITAIDHRLAAPPVITVPPMVNERLDLGERRALRPVIHRFCIRPAGQVDAGVEVIKRSLINGNRRGANGSHG